MSCIGLSTGEEFVKRCYFDLKKWHQAPSTNPCAGGFLEVAGKWVTVAIGHLVTAAVLIPALWIYDLAVSTIMAVACIFTCCLIDEVTDAWVKHTYSVLALPYWAIAHLIAMFCPFCIYECAEGN